MTLDKVLTDRLHRLLDPLQSAIRKPRLRDYGLSQDAVLPVATVRPEILHRCEHPLCRHFIADARGFHQKNAPQTGLRRYFVPTAILLDLDRFPTPESYSRAVSKHSKGSITRVARQAARLGVTCAPIRPESYVTSIAAISSSKRIRSGGPVLAAWFGAAPTGVDIGEPPTPPHCPHHWTLAWGAFVPQGTGTSLIAHLSLRRVGDMCRIFELMCHGDYLHTGAMKLLFLEVMRWLTERQAPEAQNLRWFMYGAMEHGSLGLHEWKRRMCFEPANLVFDT